MMRLLCLMAVLSLSSGAVAAADCVVLLHGLARTAMSMNPMQRALEEEGFETANIDYPSRDYGVEELADIAIPKGLSACRAKDDIGRIHFVAHSLGGILLRQYLSEKEIAELGRVVMLGPPNQGSTAVDETGTQDTFSVVLDAAHQLGVRVVGNLEMLAIE